MAQFGISNGDGTICRMGFGSLSEARAVAFKQSAESGEVFQAFEVVADEEAYEGERDSEAARRAD